jgi:galactokinase
MLIQSIQDTFIKQFDKKPLLYASPGRINLIGEHTDYNNGFVLPGAVDKQIVFALQTNDADEYRFYARDLDESFSISQKNWQKSKVHWANYLLGVIHQFKKMRLNVPGFDCVFGGDIPQGAGMSSSAALETGIAYALNDMFDFYLPKSTLAKVAQEAEHEFAGVQCGIMDQFAALYGKQDQLLRLDCRSLEFEYFPLHLENHSLLLVNSGVKHELAASEYNQRRRECETAVQVLQTFGPGIKSLRDVSKDLLEAAKNKMDSLPYLRSRFVLEENERVLQTAQALSEGDTETVGRLMFESHYGLRDLYEVSCPEIDRLITLSEKNPDVPGARMMGGGFGGCTINLVKQDATEDFKSKILSEYKTPSGEAPEIYEVKLSDGTRKIEY